MNWPTTFVDLALVGYRHFAANRCRECGVRVEWFMTPKNRKMPFHLKAGTQTQYEPHFAICRKKAA